jgi:hypothetical protein
MGAKLTFLNTVKWRSLNSPGKHRNKLQPILDYSKTCVKDDFIRAGSIRVAQKTTRCLMFLVSQLSWLLFVS